MDSEAKELVIQIRREIQEARQDVKDGFQQVNARLDLVNGRLRTTETKVAVLEDRGHWGALMWGGGGGLSIAGIIEAVSKLFH